MAPNPNLTGSGSLTPSTLLSLQKTRLLRLATLQSRVFSQRIPMVTTGGEVEEAPVPATDFRPQVLALLGLRLFVSK